MQPSSMLPVCVQPRGPLPLEQHVEWCILGIGWMAKRSASNRVVAQDGADPSPPVASSRLQGAPVCRGQEPVQVCGLPAGLCTQAGRRAQAD